MSDAGKHRPASRPHGKTPAKGAGKKPQPPSADGFLSFVSIWEEAESGPVVESAVDPLQQLREREEEIKRQGEEILRQAREEATRIEEEAYRTGFAKGEEEGLVAGRERYDEKLRQLDGLIANIAGNLDQRNRRYEEELLLLVTTMVERLGHHEVSVNPKVIQACLREALAFVIEKSVVRVHLHPDDFSRVKEASLENPALLEGKNRIELMEDGSISEGGCFLETDFGDVDATLEHRRDKLYEAVSQAFHATMEAADNTPG